MGLNERIGHKRANIVRLGLKTAIVAGAVLGVKQGSTEFDKFKNSEQASQREDNQATFASAVGNLKGIAQPVGQEGEEIISRTRGGVFGSGFVPPAPPAPPTKKGLATQAIGVATGQTTLKDEIHKAGGDFYKSSLSSEQTRTKFELQKQKASQKASTPAQGGIGTTKASKKELLVLGKNKLKMKFSYKR